MASQPGENSMEEFQYFKGGILITDWCIIYSISSNWCVIYEYINLNALFWVKQCWKGYMKMTRRQWHLEKRRIRQKQVENHLSKILYSLSYNAFLIQKDFSYILLIIFDSLHCTCFHAYRFTVFTVHGYSFFSSCSFDLNFICRSRIKITYGVCGALDIFYFFM